GLRHHHGCFAAEPRRRVCQRLRMVPARAADDATGALLGGKPGDLVVCTPDLESTDRLQHFRLHVKASLAVAGPARRKQRCADSYPGYPSLSCPDVPQRDEIHNQVPYEAATHPPSPQRGRCPGWRNERGRARFDRARPRLASAAERADVLRLWALLALGHGELDPLVIFEAAEPGRADRRVVDEDVGTPVVWGDEAEPLLGVEPLHSALNHLLCLPFEDRRGAHFARLRLLATARLTETGVGAALHPYCGTPPA